jgi:hypothetical protein
MNTPFFSIITASIQRPSLVDCCRSVNEQSFTSWEHVVMRDVSLVDTSLAESVSHPQRRLYICGPYNNFGNSPRNRAWSLTSGRFQIFLDDDNYFAHEHALGEIVEALTHANVPDLACFPILRFGQVLFDPNPRTCHVDTANMVFKRELGPWPDINDYTADGIWVDVLRSNPAVRLEVFPDVQPTVVVPRQGKGEF